MFKYIFNRILLFVPTLLAISFVTFFISINTPGDPVEIMLSKTEDNARQGSQNSVNEEDYEALHHKLHFDLPLFYFSLTDATVPDTLYKIPRPAQRQFLKRLSAEYGNWENVQRYYNALKNTESYFYSQQNSPKKITSLELINTLLKEPKEETITWLLAQFPATGDTLYLSRTSESGLRYSRAISILRNSFARLTSERKPYKKYIPVLHWYGFNNQYHHWIANFLKGDFGVSYQDTLPVKNVLYSAIAHTLGISLLSILLAYLIAVPLGIYSAIQKGTRKEKTITGVLFLLYSLPDFWIATLCVVFLCGGDYLSWAPAPGSSPIPDDAPLQYKFFEGIYRLILPLLCWTYSSLAFIARQMRGGILSSLSQDYIQTARAKGLDEKQIIWNHAMKNSLLPLLTLFAHIFPLALSGSFVIETIFNIPGMGRLTIEALYARDYPVIFIVVMCTAILTMLGNLVADILYALMDPRISYVK